MTQKPTAEDEAALLRDCKSGAAGAFEALYRLHKDTVYSFAFHMTSDPDMADEITQQTFIKAYRSLDGFRGAARFTTWLHRIVSNLCTDERRKKSSARTVSLNERFHGLLADTESDSRVMRKERIEALASGLETLSSEMRGAILMKYVSGMSYEEIAAVQECSVGTVGSRINRGLKALAEKLRGLKGHV